MGQDLLPDTVVLSTIFPNAKPSSIDVLANNWDTCTLKVHFETAPSPTLPFDLIVRMETSKGVLEAVSAMQNMARLQIPDLIPKTYRFGKGSTADGRGVEYTVTHFVPDAVTLESVWPSLDWLQQESLVDAIVEALKKVQQSDKRGTNSPIQCYRGIGGPQSGYAKDMRYFLMQFVAKHQTKTTSTSSIIETSDGIIIKSAFPDLGEVVLSNEDLQALDNDTVFCHNDMEPRNVLVRRITGDHGDDPQYELAAIIDWEMSGSFPFAFETAIKDTVLGVSSLYFDWYASYKAKTRSLIPCSDTSTKLIKAVRLIVDSQRLQRKRNVGADFRKRWLQKEGLELHEDENVGWIKADGAKAWKFSKEANDGLQMQILTDFGFIS